MTGFRSFMGISRFRWDLELDFGLAHRDSQDQAEGHGKGIEFYVPKRFQKAFVRAGQTRPRKVIDFCSWAKAPASIAPSGGGIAWLLSGTVSSPCCR